MIDLLKKLGMTELEAKCYITLHEEPELTGYEVAKRVAVSRANVYSALRSLAEKGACRSKEGDSVRYNAVPIEDWVRLFQTEFEQTSKVLIQELKTPPQPAPAFYNWQGNRGLDLALRRVIANAETSIVAEIWAEDLSWMEDVLLDAEKRGVTVVLISIGETSIPLENVIVRQRDDQWHTDERKFSLLCDSKTAFIGSFGGTLKPSSAETDHPAVIEMLKNGFYHDLIMQQIEQDFSKELDEKYGENYKKLLNYYINELGWKV
ncbi:TrmB family transcriptional regulator [Fictibacillus sp. KU28468]|uniref:TrmB family transcriptional regulator n=1 Tax=Fictibacillus sp. KU28468 TaxID=2991053 RepID=UPI0006A76929|nr:helix-turn-helix domain-containing protein [Fictibacillus sp. KU28468]UZJ79291.1 TrmB family transcriptional regulator [Fictibacillus sp. KU28468]